MKRLATLAVCAAALLANPVPAQEKIRIGFVDGFRIENESAQARRALAVLNREFEARYSELDALRRKIAAARQALEASGDRLAPAERQSGELELAKMMQQFDRMNLALAEELELRKSQERAKVIEEANLVIKAIAETGGYDLIVQQATYASSAIDITEQVLGEMAKRAAAHN
ncbi:MAG: OmpH family outer membrane protein [Burkholderiales bacterium]